MHYIKVHGLYKYIHTDVYTYIAIVSLDSEKFVTKIVVYGIVTYIDI